eukprot:TRINITY_DN5049_c0_g8_i1.p1 TRINITY_DN5049_c0_g8~~TRINITY_DN5049_c0_g8_i1.p1  ORF type:complete len:928 (-),score=253.11 TRINITY_DN5049_c0_g8_i1:148-2835(-)
MELCNCGSLDYHLRKGKIFSASVLREITRFLAKALRQFRLSQFLHREINPKHILVSLNEDNSYSYKLTGLHYCKDVSRSKAMSFVGTPDYMAPEAATGDCYEYAADVWSVGLTLYELSVGIPSKKIDPNLRSRAKKGREPIFPLGNTVPAALNDLICKCLVYEPAKRLTPEAMLQHPFLTGLHKLIVMPTAKQAVEAKKDIVKIEEQKTIAAGVEKFKDESNTTANKQEANTEPEHDLSTQKDKETPKKEDEDLKATEKNPEVKKEEKCNAPQMRGPMGFGFVNRFEAMAQNLKAAKNLVKVNDWTYSDRELLAIIATDFTMYMKHINKTENHKIKLKCEKKAVLDPYVLKSVDPINSGGFSELFLCTHKTTGEEYALKVVKTSKMTEIRLAKLLMGEIFIMLELNNCPFAIKILDYFVYRNNLCLVLEYCNGGDLDDYVRSYRRTEADFPLEQLRLVAWNAACALNELHRRNIMHRDVKPKNILVVEDTGTKTLIDVKMCDYGLSKQVAEHKELCGSTVLGTYDYFAPELYEMMEKQMTGDITTIKYDYKIDVWAYGVLLYFTIYGKTPMEPPGSKQLVIKERTISYPPLVGVPDLYMDLVKMCLIYDPSKRPSFEEILKHPFFKLITLRPQLTPDPYIMQQPLSEEKLNIQVYRATKDNKTYAIKIINSKGKQKEYLREIDTMVKLKNSRNIVKLQDYFSVRDEIYLVMDFYGDGNLENFILAKEDALSYKEQELIAYCIINGLKDIHDHHVMHRDIHPRNVLLEVDGEVKNALIADFGFARILLGETANTQVVTAYQSPEIAALAFGNSYDSRVDIWSFGMLLYFIVFGIHAEDYPGNDEIGGENIRYDEKKAEGSIELVNIMKTCLKVNPNDRPTARKLLTNPIFKKYETL